MRISPPWGFASVMLTVTAASAPVTPPSSAALWPRIQALQRTHAGMLDTNAYQTGSRTVDTYTTDLANLPANEAIRKAGGIVQARHYPNGALVIKENFNARRVPTGVTAMLKLTGYDRADRDWVMAAYTPTGKVVAYGKIASCIACHAIVTKQDFVFAPPPRQLLPISLWKAFFPKQKIAPTYAQLLRSHAPAVVR